MKRQLGENLKNKYSDSSLLFRLSSRQSQPRVLRQRVTFSTEPSGESGALTVSKRGGGEGGSCLQTLERGLVLGDSVCWFCCFGGEERMNNPKRDISREQGLSHKYPRAVSWVAGCRAGAAVRSSTRSGVGPPSGALLHFVRALWSKASWAWRQNIWILQRVPRQRRNSDSRLSETLCETPGSVSVTSLSPPLLYQKIECGGLQQRRSRVVISIVVWPRDLALPGPISLYISLGAPWASLFSAEKMVTPMVSHTVENDHIRQGMCKYLVDPYRGRKWLLLAVSPGILWPSQSCLGNIPATEEGKI